MAACGRFHEVQIDDYIKHATVCNVGTVCIMLSFMNLSDLLNGILSQLFHFPKIC